jgi:hypothetical protein
MSFDHFVSSPEFYLFASSDAAVIQETEEISLIESRIQSTLTWIRKVGSNA